MRSRLGGVTLLTLVLSLPALPAAAGEIDYTFTGTVTEISGQYFGINVGESVTYNFFVNTAQDGTETQYSGATIDYGSVYFYDAYLSGSSVPDSGYFNASTPGEIASYNLGYQWYVTGGSVNSYLNVSSVADTPLALWSSTTVFQGTNSAYDAQGHNGNIYSTLVLSAVTPVPLPGALALLPAGLAALAFAVHRRRRPSEGLSSRI